jgi:ABC-type phosphate transport system substrate-binding protein
MTTVNEALKQRYENQFPNAEVQLQTGNSDEALEALQRGEVDIAAVGRPLTDAEKAAGLVAVPVDRGKIAIIVGPDNPFKDNLTFEQFARIFRGEITDWSEVGGEPGPIRLVDRPEFSDTRRALSTYDVFKTAPFETGSNAAPVSGDETETVIEALGSDGIGYAIADQVVDADNVTIISMHQTLPDDPRYPYSQIRSYVYQQDNPSPATRAFLGFATSEPGQEVIVAAAPADGQSPEAASTATPGAALPPGTSTTASTPNPNPATNEGSATPPGLVTPPGTSTATPTPETLAEDPTTATNENGTAGGVLPPVGTTTPGDGTDTETALVPEAGAAVATTDRGFPWWLLWLLAIPLLGGLLWWLLKGRGGEPAGITSIPPGSGATATPPATGTTPTSPATGVTAATPETPVADPTVSPIIGTAVGGVTPTLTSPDSNVATPNVDAASPIASSPPNLNLGTAGLAGIAGAVGAAAGAFAWARRPLESQITLSHREPQSVYGVWNVPQADRDAAKQQGGQQLQFRVYDVTGIDRETDPPHSVQQFDCEESTQELQVAVPQGDRDYLSEVGYITDEGEWLPLCRSNSVYVPASETTDLGLTAPGIDIPVVDSPEIEQPTLTDTEWGVTSPDIPVVDSPEIEQPTLTDTGLDVTAPAMDISETDRPTVDETADIETPTNGIGLSGIALGSAALAGAALPFLGSPHTQLHLTPGANQTVIADWDITQDDMDAVKQQGGEQLQLRIYDITDIDIDTDPPHNVELFDCDESTDQVQVPVPQGDRNYAAAIGYVTADNRWLPLCRSNSVYIPASETTGLGMTSPDLTDIEEPTLAETGFGITSPSLESPNLVDTDLGVTSPELDYTETPQIEEPTFVDEIPETETSNGGIGFPGIALGSAALGGAALPFLSSPRTQLRLTPAEDQTVIADWDITQDDMDAVKQQGGQQLQLRVYDITDIDIDTDPPNNVELFDCDESTDQVQVSVPQGNCNYAAAIGYVTYDDQWLPLCCSESIYVPVSETAEFGITSPEIAETEPPEMEESPVADTGWDVTSPELDYTETPEVEEPTFVDEIPETETPNGGIGFPGIALGGAALAGAALPFLGSPQTQLRLTPGTNQTVIADWDITRDDMDAVKRQGGQQLQLRVYDVADIDIDTDPPNNVELFDCDESTDQVQVSVPQGNCNYAAAIGYVTYDDQWLPLCCSESIYVPAADLTETEISETEEPATVDSTPEIDAELGWSLSPTETANLDIAETETPEMEEPLLADPGVTDTNFQDIADPTLTDTELGMTSPSPDWVETETPLSTEGDELEADQIAEDEPYTTHEALMETETPTVSVVSPPPSQLNLVVIADQMVEANWEIPQADLDAVKQQGGQQLQLRVYDVTDTDSHTQALDTIQQYDCDESTQELRVSIPQGDRNYAAAIGYVTDEDEWLPLCCSDAVYVPALQPVEVEPTEADIEVEETPEDETSTPVNLTDVALGSAAAFASLGTIADSTEAEATPVETTLSESILPDHCEIQDLTVHSRHHCFLLTAEQMTGLKETAVSHKLEPGIHILQIKSGTFGYGAADSCREPVVLLRIDGGKVINKKTNIPVESTWSSLNGYDETLTLEVLETSTLCAFFFDTNPDDNYGEIILSVIQLDD